MTETTVPADDNGALLMLARAYIDTVGFTALTALSTLYLAGDADKLDEGGCFAAEQAGKLVGAIGLYATDEVEQARLDQAVYEVTPQGAEQINKGGVIVQLAHLLTAHGYDEFVNQFTF